MVKGIEVCGMAHRPSDFTLWSECAATVTYIGNPLITVLHQRCNLPHLPEKGGRICAMGEGGLWRARIGVPG
jgi:hypothetical protein